MSKAEEWRAVVLHLCLCRLSSLSKGWGAKQNHVHQFLSFSSDTTAGSSTIYRATHEQVVWETCVVLSHIEKVSVMPPLPNSTIQVRQTIFLRATSTLLLLPWLLSTPTSLGRYKTMVSWWSHSLPLWPSMPSWRHYVLYLLVLHLCLRKCPAL